MVAHFDWTGPIGVALPAVVKRGITFSAANIHETWIGLDAQAVLSAHLGTSNLVLLNDADAAGLAELTYGGGDASDGLVMLLTFGTGIGSAMLYNGVLVPNSELGHLEVHGIKAEHRAAASVREKNDLSWSDWADEVTTVLNTFEALFSPDLFIAGGGVSKKADKWIPLLKNNTPVVPAKLRNTAGIVGSALAAQKISHK
ncbi:hypothetical protein GCM10011410_10350 [Hoyosella rhizosphaerae]|uniref:Polyphosphate glucokinase n=1 Tax=Hoyosella rhizosphaerae TaxID=1755582 RepID=A0A916XC70_9ACTN|nr:hypothetical protein GCM10011410_10350 [Hoyosella rhizosphaerae]